MEKVAYEIKDIEGILRYLETKPYMEVKGIIDILTTKGYKIQEKPIDPETKETK